MVALPSVILYHYTSGTGLLGILNADAIWATKIHFMNDTREFRHAIDLAKGSLSDLRAGRAGDRYAQIAAALGEVLESGSKIGLFVACFSEDYDSLSQWRGYCPQSFGYNIGFDGDRLLAIAREQGFHLRPCEYDPDKQVEVTRQWAKDSVDSLMASLPDGANPRDHTHEQCNDAMQKFVRFAPYFKDRGFKDEREWRMVAFLSANDTRIGLRAGRSTLIPYVPVELRSRTEDSPVWEVRVGPTPHPELAMDAMSHLFQVAKVRNGITRTMLPYRDW